LGHTLRKARDAPSHVALEWNPQGKRTRGCPRTTWKRTVKEECGKTIPQLRVIAQDKEKWKRFVNSL